MKGIVRMFYFIFKEYVPASEIWPTAEDHTDFGPAPGFVRGYNLEVIKNGERGWMSAEYISFEPETVFNDEFHRFFRSDMGLVPTGRICFRGYGKEEYDKEEHETFITPVPDRAILNFLSGHGLKV